MPDLLHNAVRIYVTSLLICVFLFNTFNSVLGVYAAAETPAEVEEDVSGIMLATRRPDLSGYDYFDYIGSAKTFEVQFNVYDYSYFEDASEHDTFAVKVVQSNRNEAYIEWLVSDIQFRFGGFDVEDNTVVLNEDGSSFTAFDALWTDWLYATLLKCHGFQPGFLSLSDTCLHVVSTQMVSQIENYLHGEILRRNSVVVQNVPPSSLSAKRGREEDNSSLMMNTTVDPSSLSHIWDGYSFTTQKHEPFSIKVAASPEAPCGDSIWCDHYFHLIKRVFDYQNPGPYPFVDPHTEAPDGSNMNLFNTLSLYKAYAKSEECDSSRFLVYKMDPQMKGIGAMLNTIAIVLRYAICNNRVLYLMPMDLEWSEERWKYPGCRGSFLECYFLPMTQCVLSEAEIRDADTLHEGNGIDTFPWKHHRVVKMTGFPRHGKCTMCGDAWEGNLQFFDGLYYGANGFFATENSHQWSLKKYSHLWHTASFMTGVKLPWQSLMVRYMMRPRQWFKSLLRDIVDNRLVVGRCSIVRDGDTCDVRLETQSSVPGPYASIHVRFGNKAAEVDLKSLNEYMQLLRTKHPHIRNVFVSTETERVIYELVQSYPLYNFYFIDYRRQEYLDLDGNRNDFNYADEFIYSMANMYVAIHAQAFVGTLTSNWCLLIMELERTRGDGGMEYLSVDHGSAFSVCA